jgi:hypothetical protein
LIGTPIVPSGSFKAQNFNVLKLNKPSMDVKTSVGRGEIITDIVIAFYEIERCLNPIGYKCQIFRWQISTGEDQVDSRKMVPVKRIIEGWLNTI